MSPPPPRRKNFAISILPVTMLIVLIILISLVVFLFYTENETPPPVPLSSFHVERITISTSSIAKSGLTTNSVIEGLVYVASTVAEQVQGFQNVTSFGNCNGLSSNSSTQCIGMIFVTSSTQNLCFWMHDTPLPLEQVWISSSYKVVYVYQAQPESEKNVCQNAQDVLETSPNMNITLGEVVTLSPV